MTLNQFDCLNNRLQVLQESRYNHKQQMVSYDGSMTNWANIVPDSIGEEILLSVCNSVLNGKIGNNYSKTAPRALPPNFTLIRITAIKANLREKPDASSLVARVVKQGEILISSDSERIGAWYKVSDPQNLDSELWVHQTVCRLVSKKVQSKSAK